MVILGSSSPRRIELIKKLNVQFEIFKPLFDESSVPLNAQDYSLKQAVGKLNSILELNKFKEDDLILCLDTSVCLNDKIYNKPKSIEEAIEFLSELSNKTHEVKTGYTIKYKDKLIERIIISKVTFNNLSKEDILFYVNNEEVLDKAGAYAIQHDEKFHIIKAIEGSFFNIMGFPLEDIKKDFISLGLINE